MSLKTQLKTKKKNDCALLTARQMKCVTVIYACPKEAQIWMPENTDFGTVEKGCTRLVRNKLKKLIREIKVMVQGKKAEYLKSNER